MANNTEVFLASRYLCNPNQPVRVSFSIRELPYHKNQNSSQESTTNRVCPHCRAISSKGAAVRSGKSCFKTGVSSASGHSDLGTASWCVLCHFFSGWIPQIPKYRVKGNPGRKARETQPPKINYAQWNRISARALDTMEQDRKMKTSYSQDSSLICLFIWTWGKITQHFHMLQL